MKGDFKKNNDTDGYIIKRDEIGKLEIIEKLVFYCFLIALFLEIIVVIIDKSNIINPFEGRIFRVTFCLCAVKLVLTKYNIKEWLLILFFFLIGFISYKVTGRNEVVRFIAFIAASKNINRNTTLKFVLFTTLFGVSVLITLSTLGIFGDTYLAADFGRNIGVEKRYCLGLGHPNALHCMFWALLSLLVYLFLEKLKWWHYAFLGIFDLGLFILTDSRTGFLVSLLVIICGIIYSINPSIKNKKWIYVSGVLLLFACVSFSIDAATYNGYFDAESRPIMAWIDVKMTGRVFEGGITGSIEKWSLFSDLKVKGYTDMGYIKLFHWYGIIPACLYLISILLLIRYSYKKRNASELILICSFSIYTLVEAHAISPYFGRNYLIMLFIGVWNEIFGVAKGTSGYFWQLKKIFCGLNIHKEKLNV